MLAMNVNVTKYEKNNLKGLASVDINGNLQLNGIRIMESKGKVFVSMPSYKSNKNGEYFQYYHPVTKEFYEALETEILAAYHLALEGKKPEKKEAVEDIEVSSVRVTPYDKDNMKGFATVVLNECIAIHSVKILQGEYGTYPAMPSYKGADGDYHEIVECSQNLKNSIKREMRKAMKEEKPDIQKPTTEKPVKKTEGTKTKEVKEEKPDIQKPTIEEPVKKTRRTKSKNR